MLYSVWGLRYRNCVRARAIANAIFDFDNQFHQFVAQASLCPVWALTDFSRRFTVESHDLSPQCESRFSHRITSQAVSTSWKGIYCQERGVHLASLPGKSGLFCLKCEEECLHASLLLTCGSEVWAESFLAAASSKR